MLLEGVAELYRGFAAETAGESPCFTAWASDVAQDPQVLGWLATLPAAKQQPNLVFAAARWNGVAAPGPYGGLREALLERGEAVRHTILQRSTQTNEPRRMATLMPVFAQIAQESGGPLALVEVGASAGLCLYPDRFGYDWGTGMQLTSNGAPVLHCDAAGPMPVPFREPDIAWRGGSDRNPLDVKDDDSMRWLRTLIWPEQEQRRELLEAAIPVARSEPPALVRGDLFDTLDEVVHAAASHGTVVVFHSAVVAYLDDASRRRFAARMQHLVDVEAVRWVSNEGDRVLPEITRTARRAGRPSERFVLGLDGRAVARTHGHGASLTWLG
jgi:hypothetical protein